MRTGRAGSPGRIGHLHEPRGRANVRRQVSRLDPPLIRPEPLEVLPAQWRREPHRLEQGHGKEPDRIRHRDQQRARADRSPDLPHEPPHRHPLVEVKPDQAGLGRFDQRGEALVEIAKGDDRNESPGALVPVIALGDFNQSLAALIESPQAGLVRLYLDERVTMRRLMREIRRSVGSRALLVPVPYSIGLLAVALLETVRLPPPLSRENLQGLRANQGRIEAGDLSAYVRSPTGLVEMTDAAR